MTLKKTAFISHPDTLLHVMDGQHPESPARIIAIQQALNKSVLRHQLQFIDAPLASKSQLQRVHNPRFVDYIFNIAPRAGLVRLDADTAMGPSSLEAALRASGAVIHAVDLVLEQKIQKAFCCVRPPGHHAGISHSAGFCIFNQVAVGVAHALTYPAIKKVAIIDFDVHHGDGTEEIFRHNPNVMLCSTFQHPFYPHRGADTSNDHIINVPLAANSEGVLIKQAFQQQFAPALHRFKPDLVFISAGFDAHHGDPLANLQLTSDDYAWITNFTIQIANQYADGRIISSLEGGYHLDHLAKAALAHIQALVN